MASHMLAPDAGFLQHSYSMQASACTLRDTASIACHHITEAYGSGLLEALTQVNLSIAAPLADMKQVIDNCLQCTKS